jgi:hypothetical protein
MVTLSKHLGGYHHLEKEMKKVENLREQGISNAMLYYLIHPSQVLVRASCTTL